MKLKLPLLIAAALLPAGAEVGRKQVDQVTSEKVDFTSGGAVRVEHSAGELNIEAWDEPDVQVTVTREDWVRDKARALDRAGQQLKDIKVTVTKNGNDIVISTVRKHSIDINLDYRIMVPKNARLVVEHETGDVVIDGVDADIDAKVRTGGILLMIPESGKYSFDARVTSGGIYSDFEGRHHHAALNGETFLENEPDPARKIHLHVGVGGIEIQKMVPFREPVPQLAPGAKPASGF